MKRFLIFIAMTIVAFVCQGHNTNVTHPVMTLEAIRLIEANDKKEPDQKYDELYRLSTGSNRLSPNPYYWGTWNTFEESGWPIDPGSFLYEGLDAAAEDENNNDYGEFFSFNPMNVNSGVVLEDTPFTKVFNHFYHAYTGKAADYSTGISLVDSAVGVVVDSRTRALGFLVEATNIYSYEAYAGPEQFIPDEWVNLDSFPKNAAGLPEIPFAKMLSFQSFGEALHHVEDMSSIAHVHNDSHLSEQARKYWFAGNAVDHENDDYEALYLPNKIFQFHNIGFRPDTLPSAGNWFVNTRKSEPKEIENITDIWPDPIAEIDWETTSLARKIYNASIFKANLPTPDCRLFEIAPPTPSGELAFMFQDRIRWRGLLGTGYLFPLWTIEGVGNWHYCVGGDLYINGWWPIKDNGGPVSDGQGMNYYYLEQKMGIDYVPGEPSRTDFDEGVVKVDVIRKDLFKEFKSGADFEQNFAGDINLLEKFAHQLIPLGIEYAAGFSQYWFDRVNTPPYLKSVVVKQNAIDIPSLETPENPSKEFTGYKARWRNFASKLTTLYDNSSDEALFTARRELKKDRETRPLYNNRDLEITLTFNEAIKSPTYTDPANGRQIEREDGLKIELEVISSDESKSNNELSVRTIKFDMAELEYIFNDKDYDFDGDPDNLKFNSWDPSVTESHLVGSIWKVTIPASEFENENLEGGIRLVVYASDKNHHRIPDGRGSRLDSTPDTPAKVFVALNEKKLPQFFWHSSLTLPPEAEYGDSVIDTSGNKLPPGSFAYDDFKGDSNHILWFSSKPDTSEILEGVNTNSDSVSITTLPDFDKPIDATPVSPLP